MQPTRLLVSPRILPKLAFADLWHEWVLSLCVATALAAIMAPLLLLLGLKHGTIETLRDRLIQDPAYRAVRPARTEVLAENWFGKLRQNPQVGFVVPTILRGSSILHVASSDSRDGVDLDMVSTAAGDPLLVENGVAVPSPVEAVLSEEAAKQLKVKPGDPIRLHVGRGNGAAEEAVDVTFRVSGLLSPRGDPLPRLYVSHGFAEDVETFRSGMTVPERGWPGGIRLTPPSYDGVVMLTPGQLDLRLRSRLLAGTGFAQLEELGPSGLKEHTGFSVDASWRVYDLHVINDPAAANGVETVHERLRGQDVILVPYARRLMLRQSAGEVFPVESWSMTAEDSARIGIMPMPWGAAPADGAFPDLGMILWPQAASMPDTLTVNVDGMVGTPSLPLKVAGTAPGPVAIIPSGLAGILRTGQRREVGLDAASQHIVFGRPAASGFRLFARTIDDVAPLTETLREQGVQVNSEAQAIERIHVLNRGLTRMFWLVAVVGIVGGVAALVASLYAAVQRKRRDLGMMRLLGMPRISVFLFPICQSTALATTAAIMALLAFETLAAIINQAFASDLDLGQRLCWLPASYLLTTLIGAPLAASACALLAGNQATKVEPAEAIRDE